MRQTIIDLQASRIRDVANAGLGRNDVLAFWFGESDEVSPAFVRQAAIDSLNTGETFYAHNLGLPSLREAIAAEMQTRHSADIGAQRIAVTSGGVNALMLAMQALLNPGDQAVVVTPVWPNLTAQPVILGAQLHTVCLQPQDGQWALSMDSLLAAVTDRTRLLVLNSPNNPTGWTLTREEQQTLLKHCRLTGTWILADEVYENLFYLPSANLCAPSFLDIAAPEDKLVVAHSFSKSFLMTGWRLGWLVMPPAMTEHMGKLIEFNTSCASVFVQRAGEAAMRHAQEVVPRVVAQMRTCRDRLFGELDAIPGLEWAIPDGGMYAFFSIPGHADDVLTAKRLVAEAGLGLAPGSAFAPEAKGWLRWCFASKDPDRLGEGAQRLRQWLGKL
ncbi:MAG: pyridoxal phosphate-dependent aminotransferase [Limnohabitans sp.]